ncbi:unnamed protein product [Pylaiella littoralis]
MPTRPSSTAAPTPSDSIRGDPTDNNASGGASAGGGAAAAGGLVIPEGKVAVWDNTMKQMVIKDKEDVKLKTWSTRIRDAAWNFWAGGPPVG